MTPDFFSSRRLAAFLSGAAILFTSSWSLAQETENEGQLRLRADAKKKLNKEWRVFLRPEIRTKGWDFENYMVEAGVRYKPLDYLALKTAFRFELTDKESDNEFTYRWRLDATGSLPLGRYFEAQARLRYAYVSSNQDSPESRIRPRALVEYKPLKRLAFSLSAEAFWIVTDGDVSKMRYGSEVYYDFYRSKKVDQFVTLEYLLDYSLQEPQNTHIVRVGYGVAF